MSSEENFPSGSFLDKLISSFPEEWQGFFAALNTRNGNPVRNAALWLQEEQEDSKRNHAIAANPVLLFDHLTRDFPLVYDMDLFFKPKILLLPLNLQRNVLTYILCNSCEIPLECLQQLDKKLDECKDDVQGLHKLLKLKLNEISNANTSMPEIPYMDVITQRSKDRFRDLCQQMTNTPCNEFAPGDVKWKSLEPDPQIENIKPSMDTDTVQSHNGRPVTLGSSLGFGAGEAVNEEKPLFVETIDVDVADHCDAVHSISGKKAKLEVSVPNPPEFDDQSLMIKLDVLPSADLKKKLEPLCDLIQSLESSEMVKVPTNMTVLEVLSELSSTEIDKAYSLLQLDSVSEPSAVCLCQHFIAIQPDPSYMHACAFLGHCIFTRLQKLEHAASRLLTTTIASFGKRHSKALCDGLFIKLLVESSFSSFQADLICKIIKDALDQDTVKYLFSAFLKIQVTDKYWSKDTVLVVQTIMDCKLEVDSETFRLHLLALQNNAVAMAKTLKFAKLLLATIKNYSTHVAVCKKSVLDIIEINQTFLKKAALASLNKI